MKIEPVGIYVKDPNENTAVTIFNVENFAKSTVSFSPAEPVELGDWIIPEQIECEFIIQGLQAKVRSVWKIELVIHIENKIPHTKKISLSVEGKSPLINRPLSERIENSYLALTASQLRELEVLAIQSVRKRWKFNSTDRNWTRLEGQEITKKEILAMKKEILNRTSYRTLDDQFLKEVAGLFIEAERKGERTNVFVANEIGRREGRFRSARTSEKWIAEARKKGFLALPNRKKTTTPKKGKAK